jgi:hypothetical protein
MWLPAPNDPLPCQAAAAINDVIVQIHTSGFVLTETEWPSSWTFRADRECVAIWAV